MLIVSPQERRKSLNCKAKLDIPWIVIIPPYMRGKAQIG